MWWNCTITRINFYQLHWEGFFPKSKLPKSETLIWASYWKCFRNAFAHATRSWIWAKMPCTYYASRSYCCRWTCRVPLSRIKCPNESLFATHVTRCPIWTPTLLDICMITFIWTATLPRPQDSTTTWSQWGELPINQNAPLSFLVIKIYFYYWFNK